MANNPSRFLLTRYALRHLQTGLAALGEMLKQPMAMLLSISVIAIALSLPASLIVMMDNFQSLAHIWHNQAQISLYVAPGLSDSDTQSILKTVRDDPGVDIVQYISPAKGLHDFSEKLPFKDVLTGLDDNPLPGVIEITPRSTLKTTLALDQLLHRLQALPHVQIANMDLAWLKRMLAFLRFVTDVALVLGVILGFGVVLLIGNTIRLQTENRRDRIAVYRLCGATTAFIRRPFLYHGFLQGAFGGVFGWLLVDVFMGILATPVTQIALAYNSTFLLMSIPDSTGLWMVLTGGFLGWIGAWLALVKHL